MAELRNDFEGRAVGTVVSAANSGGAAWRNAFDSVGGPPASGFLAFDNTHAGAHGAQALKIGTAGTAGPVGCVWTTSAGTMNTVWARCYAYFTANPSAETRVMDCGNAAQTLLFGGVSLLATGKLSGFNSAGASLVATTASVGLNQWIRIEMKVVVSATVGQVEVKLFNGTAVDDVTPTETKTSAASANTGTAPAGNYRLGDLGVGFPATYVCWYDSWALSSNGYPGPDASHYPYQVSTAIPRAATW
jgi:hypothetical protein